MQQTVAAEWAIKDGILAITDQNTMILQRLETLICLLSVVGILIFALICAGLTSKYPRSRPDSNLIEKNDIVSKTGLSRRKIIVVSLVLILMLVSFAIPTFTGIRDRGYDSQARSNLRDAVIAAKTYFVDNESYSGVNASGLIAYENSIPFKDDFTKGCYDPTDTSNGRDSDHAIVYIDNVNSDGDYTCLATWTRGSDKWYYFMAKGSNETLSIK